MFSAFTVKVTLPEKPTVLSFEWTMMQSSTKSLAASNSSCLLSALLDPGISLDSVSSFGIVRRKYRVGDRVLAYLQSHSTVLATVCGLLSCRKSRPTSENNSGQEEPAENCMVYYRRSRRIVEYSGCTFVREVQVPCTLRCGSASRHRAGVTLGDPALATIDENLRDYIFRKLKNQLPTLKRFLIQFMSPLMLEADEPKSDAFWLLCSTEIPDELCAVLPSIFADRYFAYHVYRHISQLLQIHSLQSVGLSKFVTRPNRCNIEEILKLFEVIPSSVVRNSILWAALHNFIVTSAVHGGSLTSAHALRVHDPGSRCRLLLSTLADPSEKSTFSDMLKSCLNDGKCPELKRVVEKRIVTERLHSEVVCDIKILCLLSTTLPLFNSCF